MAMVPGDGDVQKAWPGMPALLALSLSLIMSHWLDRACSPMYSIRPTQMGLQVFTRSFSVISPARDRNLQDTQLSSHRSCGWGAAVPSSWSWNSNPVILWVALEA